MQYNKVLKGLYIFLILFLSAVLFFGCKRREDVKDKKKVITVKGSDTMVNLSQRWAEVYMENNPNISIQVTGGGSGTGVASLLNGTTQIANASREFKPSEYEAAKSRGVNPKEYEVALDGLAVIVNPNNPVETLTMEQIRKIFIGEIKNWRELGGKEMPITLYGRENSSGTYEFFKDHVLDKKDFAINTQVLQGTAALGEAVARDVKGIGYGGVGYFAERKDIKITGVKKNKNSEAVYPANDGKVNYEVIWNNSYSISRYLYCYTDDDPNEDIKDFLDFILSDEGQELVKQMEYIPLPKGRK